ncbi:MAG TPA: helix-turn-helix transcriptional regulator [Solirubrobacterales bacterium]|nr:helix-turn-helix transcriptional regulator [Solirubrobacterales bacterium]
MSSESELRIADVKAALTFAAELAGCTEEAGFVDRTGALGALIGAEGVIVVGGRDWMGEVVVEVGDPGLYSPELLGAIGRDWRDHPVMAPDLAAAAPGARRLSDFVPSREWHRRDIFNDFYRPLGLPNELSAQLAWGPAGSSCCIALHRSGHDFGPRERTLLELLAPHLRAARSRIEARHRRLPITPREAEVLARLAAGRTNAGIAHDLGISSHTVVRHVDHIYRKLGVQTRAAATRVALTALPDDA